MEEEMVQVKNLNGLLGNGEWLDWLVKTGRKKIRRLGQGGLGKRHVDGSMGVAVKCML